MLYCFFTNASLHGPALILTLIGIMIILGIEIMVTEWHLPYHWSFKPIAILMLAIESFIAVGLYVGWIMVTLPRM